MTQPETHTTPDSPARTPSSLERLLRHVLPFRTELHLLRGGLGAPLEETLRLDANGEFDLLVAEVVGREAGTAAQG